MCFDKTNYFVEGLQGAGKSTLVQKLSDRLNDSQVFREGDYSPVELAWCAYVTQEQYEHILARYPMIEAQIREKTVTEGRYKIICYTQILTDLPNFHKTLETYEIYNGNLDQASFESVILERFEKWNGSGQIFECSIFQNIIENQILYLMMTDEEIFDFYKRLKRVLAGKPYHIIYLDVEDIAGTIDVIRKERSDENGNEMWFPLMMQYLQTSPYGKEHRLTDLDGLLAHLAHRRALERRLLNELFEENSTILKSKNDALAPWIASLGSLHSDNPNGS
ncbi:MAG: deoxynucleoside kinase [Lachnospiraceae bacterium]|nr:deoxynucleoside kinase [Lachnospiraceae bacterium]